MAILFGILINFFVELFGRTFFHAAFKIAITLAFIAMVVAAVYAYVQAYGLIISGISQTVPDIVAGVWGWFMPSNVSSCILAIFSCIMLKFVTKLYLQIYNFKVKAAISN